MTEEELAKEILQDFVIVKRKAEYLVQSVRREAIKSMNKYCHKVFPYTSKKKNTWLIFVDYYKKDPVYTAVVHYLDKNGFNAVMVDKNQKTLSHYSAHFLERFNARYWKKPNATKLEILKRFVSKNPCSSNQLLPNKFNCQNGFFGVFQEGKGLGYIEQLTFNNIYRFKTFISTSMVHKGQASINDLAIKNYNTYLVEPFKDRFLRRDLSA